MRVLKQVFVVGSQRGGTTLVGQILGAHPKAVLIDEDSGVYGLINAILAKPENERESLRQCVQWARNFYVGNGRFSPDGDLADGVSHLIFKAPNATYDYARLRQIFDDQMRFVFVVRDVRDVVCSMGRLVHIPMVENQLKRIRAHGDLAERFAPELKLIENGDSPDHIRRAVIWKIKTGLYSEFCCGPLNAVRLRYEDLVSNPTEFVALILEHVGLAGHLSEALHHELVFRGLGPGLTDRTRDIDESSLQRWRRQLSPEQEDDVWSVAGELMNELGYAREPQATRSFQREIPGEVISQPVVATGRGGSGTRLLSLALMEHGIFLGNRLNQTEDSVEWVDLIYELAIRKLTGHLPPGTSWCEELRARARIVLRKGEWREPQLWGWKLPETTLILPEIARAFSAAKIIHLVRHPLDTCLRRTHMTSRMDNAIGEATLLAAYRWLGWNRDPRADEDHIRNAASWVYQLQMARDLASGLSPERYLEIKYEDLCTIPQEASDRIASFLGIPKVVTNLQRMIDPARRRLWESNDKRVSEVWSTCEKMAMALGYRLPD